MNAFLPDLLTHHTTLVLIAICGLFLAVVNILAFVAFGLDKHQADNDKRRVSKLFLLSLAACGGTLGAKLARRWFEHDGHSAGFRLVLNMVLILQLGAIGLALSPLGPTVKTLAVDTYANLSETISGAKKNKPKRFGPGGDGN